MKIGDRVIGLKTGSYIDFKSGIIIDSTSPEYFKSNGVIRYLVKWSLPIKHNSCWMDSTEIKLDLQHIRQDKLNELL